MRVKPHRVESVILAATGFLLMPGPLIAGPIKPVDQDRSANAMAIVPPCGGQTEFDSAAAIGFEPFTAAIDALQICDFAQGIACAAHLSEIGSSLMSAWGNATSGAASASPTVIHAIPTTTFEVDFELVAEAEFIIAGSISAQGAAPLVLSQARVKLTDAGGAVVAQQVVNPGSGGTLNQQDVDHFGVLGPGSYTLLADAIALIDSTVPPNGGGMAQFGITFHAAIPGDVNDDDLVKVHDVLAVIAGWGECAQKAPCAADIAPLGGDGLVGIADLLKVISNWG